VKERELTPELERIADLLDEVALEQRTTLTAAENLDQVPGLDRVELLRGLPLPEARAPRHGALIWFTAILAVAASLVVALRALAPAGEEAAGPGTEFLAGGEFGLLPSGNSGAWSRLDWTFGGAQGIVFEVRVLDPSDEKVLLRERVRATSLPLDAERTLTWPPTVLVEIDALDAGGRLVDSLQELLSLSSR